MKTNPDQSIPELKAALRSQIRAAIRSVSPDERTAASRLVCQRLEQFSIWRDADAILFYAPLADEVDVWPLLAVALAKGKMIALPRFRANQDAYEACLLTNLSQDLQPGNFGVREPSDRCPVIPINQLDLVLVPGVAFAVDGHRLGRGKGYYDRLLANVRGAKCGLAFEQQVVTEIPAEPHDRTLDCIVTPTRLVAIGQDAAK